jgi:hypothetical protein
MLLSAHLFSRSMIQRIGIEYAYTLPFMRKAAWESFHGAVFHFLPQHKDLKSDE